VDLRFSKGILLAVLAAFGLAACNSAEHIPDWDDVLPPFVTEQETAAVIYINDPFEVFPPIEFPPIATEAETTVTEEITVDEYDDFDAWDAIESGNYGFDDDIPPPFTEAFTSDTSVYFSEYDQAESYSAYTETETSAPPSHWFTTATTPSESGDYFTAQSDMTELIKPALQERPFSYQSLNSARRHIYDSVIEAVLDMKPEVTLSGVSDEDYKFVYELIYAEEDLIFNLGRKISYNINGSGDKVFQLEYIYSKEETAVMQREIEAAAGRILLSVNDNMTAYEKVKMFFDELALNCEYDAQAENKSDVYGALVRKKAACAGLAKSLNYLCRRAGIESLLITGEFDVPHMWNMVKIESEWYHIDPTTGIANNSSIQYARYDYFGVTDEFIKRTRTIYPRDFSYPPAVYTTFNYFKMSGLFAESYADAERIIKQSAIEASKNKERVIQFSVSSTEVFNETVKKLFTEQQALNILDAAYPSAQNKFNRETIAYNQDSKTLVIKIFLEYT